MAHVTLISHLRAPGWSGDLDALNDSSNHHRVVPLRDALTAVHSGAPLMQVSVVRDKADLQLLPEQPRLTKNKRVLPALDTLDMEVVFECIVFDVDCRVKDTKGIAPVAWRNHQYRLFSKIPDGYGFYETPGGYRLLWELPTPLRVPEYEKMWLAMHAHLASILQVDGETEVDEKCKDWTRLFYLPFITKPGYGDLRLDIDVDEMGVLNWTPPGLFGGLTLDALKHKGFELPEVIGEGEPGRNNTLFRYAASLRARGADEETLRDKLILVNEERCVPPLENSEVEGIVQSVVTRYDAPDPADAVRSPDLAGVNPADAFYTPPGERVAADVVSGQIPVLKLGDEAELAELLLTKFETDNVACVLTRGKLHHYNKLLGYWEAVPKSTLYALVQRFSGIPVESGSDKDGMLKTRPLRVSMGNAKGAVSFALAMRDKQAEGFFDHRVPGAVFRNGFVRIDKGGEAFLTDPDPSFRSDVFLDYEYVPNAQPTRFIEFLNDLFIEDRDKEEKVNLIREFFGAALAGQTTRYAKALMLLGDGSNGKSTLLQIIEALFPQALRASVLPHDMSRHFARASLAGKTVNIVTEMSKNAILDSEGFKAIISGDQIQAEEKHGQPFVFKPTAAHVFAANTLPVVSDSSDGFWRRWLVVDFNRIFTKADAKPGLAEDIVAEELGLIASWLIDAAAVVWKRRHFAETDTIAAQRRAWRGESDTIRQFLLELLEEPGYGFGNATDEDREDELFVENKVLYQRYQQWAMASGLKTRSKTNLSRELIRIGIPKARKANKRGFKIPTDTERILH